MIRHSSAYERGPRLGIAKFNQLSAGGLGMLATTYDIPHDAESGRCSPFGSYELVEGSPLHEIFTILTIMVYDYQRPPATRPTDCSLCCPQDDVSAASDPALAD